MLAAACGGFDRSIETAMAENEPLLVIDLSRCALDPGAGLPLGLLIAKVRADTAMCWGSCRIRGHSRSKFPTPNTKLAFFASAWLPGQVPLDELLRRTHRRRRAHRRELGISSQALGLCCRLPDLRGSRSLF